MEKEKKEPRYIRGKYTQAQKEATKRYLAKAYDVMGDSAMAEEHFKAYIQTAPTDAVALNELGEIMLEKGRYDEAVLYLEQGLACEVVPNKGALMHDLVAAYEYNGQFDKAWELIQEYIALFPEDEEAQREYIFLKNRQMKPESTQDIEASVSTEDAP